MKPFVTSLTIFFVIFKVLVLKGNQVKRSVSVSALNLTEWVKLAFVLICGHDFTDFYIFNWHSALSPRAAQYEGRSPRLVTSVTRVRGGCTWWRGSAPRGSTSTGSVFAVLPAAPRCGRERTPSTLKRVRISHVSSQQYWIYMLLIKFSNHSAAFCWHFAVILQGNCTASFISTNATMGRPFEGICLYVQWVLCVSNNILWI